MTSGKPNDPSHIDLLTAALYGLLTATSVMLLSLVTRTPPHPPLEVAPFALGPFLGASLALGLAALPLLRQARRSGVILSLLFALSGLLSFGPQKYLDPAFSRIWPAVIVAQIAILAILALGALLLKQPRQGATADGRAGAG